MTSNPSQFTLGEIKALIAPIMNLTAEDIDNVVIITRGACPDCGGRDATTVYHNVDTLNDFSDILSNAVISQLPDVELCQYQSTMRISIYHSDTSWSLPQFR